MPANCIKNFFCSRLFNCMKSSNNNDAYIDSLENDKLNKDELSLSISKSFKSHINKLTQDNKIHFN